MAQSLVVELWAHPGTLRPPGDEERQAARARLPEARPVRPGVKATGGKATFVGINTNYGYTAKITNSCITDTKAICEEFEGNDTGAEPKQISEGPSSACIYTPADIAAC